MAEITVVKATPKSGWRPAIFILYGLPKLGKSTLASHFSPKGIDDVLTLDMEESTHDIVGANRIDIQNPTHFIESIQFAKTSKYGTISFDPIDINYQWAKEMVLAKANKNKKEDDMYDVIGQMAEGTGWDRSKDIFMKMVMLSALDLKKAGKVVILVSHVKSPNDDPSKDKMRTVDLPGSIARQLTAAVNGVFLMYSQSNGNVTKRQITTIPYQQVDAGCRWKEFRDKMLEINLNDPFAAFRKALEAK